MSTSTFPILPILLVDDESHILELFEMALRSDGIDNVLLCRNVEHALKLFSEWEIGVVLLDLLMPPPGGENLLERISLEHPEVPVVVITALNDVRTAVRCVRAGAFDYLVKPIEEERLCAVVRRAIEMRQLRNEVAQLSRRVLNDTIENPRAFEKIITVNRKMHSLFKYVEAIAPSPQPVFISGETGVGKELFARALHDCSARSGEFISVNVAGLDDSLFADTLFGHKKGAFTSAFEDAKGLVERAAGGTLFLDEIGDLSPQSQVKLLRLIQEREYYLLGSTHVRHTDARIVVATHADIHRKKESGELRHDLYYRLITHSIHVPPLRERRDDLALLLEHFLAKTALALNKKKPTPPAELLDLLRVYDFPGNVRELESMVFDAVSRHTTKMLSMHVFKERIGLALPMGRDVASPFLCEFESASDFPTLKEASDFLVREAMRLGNNNQSIAAQLLGITRSALNQRLNRQRTELDAFEDV